MLNRTLFHVAFLLALVCSGCIYVPKSNAVRPASMVGTDRAAVIRVGEAKRQMVLEKFGRPQYRTPDDRALGYTFYYATGSFYGIVLAGPCSTPHIGSSEWGDRDDLWLKFDAAGVLQHFEKNLAKKFDDDSERAWSDFKSRP